jgi:hypothetical protein
MNVIQFDRWEQDLAELRQATFLTVVRFLLVLLPPFDKTDAKSVILITYTSFFDTIWLDYFLKHF